MLHLQAAKTLISVSNPVCIDIASGAGEPGISLAKQYPSGTFLITDIAPGMVRQAAKQAAEAGVKNARCAALAAGVGICAPHLHSCLPVLLLSTQDDAG